MPEARGITLASIHLIPGEQQGGRSPSRGHPCQHLPSCCSFQVSKSYSPSAQTGAPCKCQQSPGGFPDHQGIHRCRWRAIWELGIVFCQNESQTGESIKEVKGACSQVNLDAQTTCSQLTLEAKTNCSQAILEVKTAYSTVVKKAQTTRGHMVQEAEAICSKAIGKVEAQWVSQGESFQREHGNIMQDLEVHVIQEESRSRADFLSAYQVALYNSPPELKSALATSYHMLLGQTPPSPPLALPQRTSPVEGQLTSAAPPTPVPEQSPRPKRQHLSPDPMESTPLGQTTPKVNLGGPPSTKRQEIPPWFRTLKPSYPEAFSQDSDLVREARREFFSKHSYNFTTDSTHNL